MSRSWSDWFIFQVKSDLREKMTSLDDVWGLMFLSPEKQAILDSATQLSENIIKKKDAVIEERSELIEQLHAEIEDLRAQIKEERRITRSILDILKDTNQN